MGNRPSEENLAALERGLADQEPLVRGASAWAIGRHVNHMPRAILMLEPQLSAEEDVQVCEEIRLALFDLGAANGSNE